MVFTALCSRSYKDLYQLFKYISLILLLKGVGLIYKLLDPLNSRIKYTRRLGHLAFYPLVGPAGPLMPHHHLCCPAGFDWGVVNHRKDLLQFELW